MATDEQKQVAVNKLEALNKSIDDFLNSKDNQVAQVFQLVEKYTRVPRKYIFLGKAVATFVPLTSLLLWSLQVSLAYW